MLDQPKKFEGYSSKSDIAIFNDSNTAVQGSI